MFYAFDERPESLPHNPLKAMIAPRPIGWVSTLGPDGTPNLAPYSFFNMICDTPPLVAYSSAGFKHSAAFSESGGEFVWNLATYDLREAMNLSSAGVGAEVDEFEHAGLETAPSQLVKPPRVAASPASLECKVVSVTELTGVAGERSDHWLVIGQVVGVHIAEHAIVDGRFDTAGVQPLGRCGYRGDYARVTELFDMPRP